MRKRATDQGFLLQVAANEIADGESGRMLLTGRAFELWVASPPRSSVGLRNQSSVDVDQEDLARGLPADLRSQALLSKPARRRGWAVKSKSSHSVIRLCPPEKHNCTDCAQDQELHFNRFGECGLAGMRERCDFEGFLHFTVHIRGSP
jgi:hypothetical protein